MAEHELKRSFNAQAKGIFQISHIVFSSHADGDYEHLDSTKLNQKKIVCAISCIRSVKCTLSSIPSLKEGFSYADPVIGQNFIKTIMLYTGYVIYFTISIGDADKTRSKGLKGGVGVSFGKAAASTPSEKDSDSSETTSDSSKPSQNLLDMNSGLSAGSHRGRLKKKKFTEVKICSTTYGNITLPYLRKPGNLEELDQLIGEIYTSFQNQAARVTSPKCWIDEQQLGSYTVDVPHQHVDDQDRPPFTTYTPPIELPPLSVDVDFCTLAGKIAGQPNWDSKYSVPIESSL